MFYLNEESLIDRCGQLGIYLMAAGIVAFYIETEYDPDAVRLALIGTFLYIIGSFKRLT